MSLLGPLGINGLKDSMNEMKMVLTKCLTTSQQVTRIKCVSFKLERTHVSISTLH